jgi:hypothetical protein
MSETVELPPCPTCGESTLATEWRLEATKGLLGGSQLKVAAKGHPWLVCPCGFTERGRLV